MRHLWNEYRDGYFLIETEKITIRLMSRAYRNYRNTESIWTLIIFTKNPNHYSSYNRFLCSLEDAMAKAESIVAALYEATSEII